MSGLDSINKDKLEDALSQIRKDMVLNQIDHAYAGKNVKRWIFIIIWLLTSIVLFTMFGINEIRSLVFSAIAVFIFSFFDGMYIVKQAYSVKNKRLEDGIDTRVDLS